MQRRFLKFIIWTIVVGTMIIAALSGCSIYKAIDEKIHPTPQIEEDASYSIEKNNNGALDVNLTVSVTDGEMVMFYYFCKADSGWDSEVEVGSQQVADGKARNTHVTECDTELMVKAIAYHNYRKKSQRHHWMAWIINVKDYAKL